MTQKNLETIVAVNHERLTSIENQQQDDRKRLNGNLERIYNKIENMENKMNTRLPLWATALITILTSGIVGVVCILLSK